MKYLVLIFVIVVIVQPPSFCQIEFRETIINNDTLICTSGTGAAALATYISKIEQENKLIQPLDSALNTCRSLVRTKDNKIYLFQEKIEEGAKIIEDQKSIMFVQKQQMDADKILIEGFDRDLKKAKRRTKTSLILGGVLVGVLTGVIIAIAI